jgi:hypothetical protein
MLFLSRWIFLDCLCLRDQQIQGRPVSGREGVRLTI